MLYFHASLFNQKALINHKSFFNHKSLLFNHKSSFHFVFFMQFQNVSKDKGHTAERLRNEYLTALENFNKTQTLFYEADLPKIIDVSILLLPSYLPPLGALDSLLMGDLRWPLRRRGLDLILLLTGPSKYHKWSCIHRNMTAFIQPFWWYGRWLK